MKYKFYILGGGDRSVGIGSTDEEVIFDGNMELDEDMIKNVKEFLNELDDNCATVYTEQEFKDSQKAERDTINETAFCQIQILLAEGKRDEALDIFKSVVK